MLTSAEQATQKERIIKDVAKSTAHTPKKHIKSSEEKEREQKIKKFLQTNYKTQYLPNEAKQDPHLPSQFTVPEMQDILFEEIMNGNLESVRAIVANYKNFLEIQNAEGYSPLSYAILHSQNTIVEFLIKRGANTASMNRYSAYPITVASRYSNLKAVELLLKSNCQNLENKDKFGNSALDYALINNNQDAYDVLVKHARSNTK